MPPDVVTVAHQQPEWPDPDQARQVRNFLRTCPVLVGPDDVLALRAFLGRVAAGEAYVLQAGDCAEPTEECDATHVRRKMELINLMAATMRERLPCPVLRVGRIAGQFTKPRSNPTETVGGLTLPAYRGHLVNGPNPDATSRQPDPLRIISGYAAAGGGMSHLGWPRPEPLTWSTIESAVWSSHEALLLDYEMPLTREMPDGRRWLGSTHWPWIGNRTRQLDGAHVALMSSIVNPVACKVGPGMDPTELVALCDRLDPRREPGRLTLITRMGADRIANELPRLVQRVRAAGHPVIWLCDPMHGNTVLATGGRKTRTLTAMTREVQLFTEAVAQAGGVAGGLHLEVTPQDVTECVASDSELAQVAGPYTSYCDPRLNPQQAVALVQAWSPARRLAPATVGPNNTTHPTSDLR
ncbi:3-deoxy-7-phosphoheptulonate synthase [Solwaraspora sp. WMMD791]|uniref:3-deoxy-7-phosphoheptulonate synthase n=1 Tax=Solwaraspora sp. WMMD791 TaxID=3016086 RepID=UPI00249C3A10|nr:3-deoxy-7-phosphoheptulonate synthase [Solwaraspora sp. WMMD791]WFE26121.1 3-deoxy-7-phosphoheptulonate synthase [Solwaraspora sp. WMMD791]